VPVAAFRKKLADAKKLIGEGEKRETERMVKRERRDIFL